MSILRYTASLDNTITNAFQSDLTTRGTGSNMGLSSVLEVFSVYGQATSASSELSRVLIQFPTASIAADRSSGLLPASGSVTWKLKLYSAKHFATVPRLCNLKVSAISGSWQEGIGLDMEGYLDLTKNEIGSNWINANGSLTKASATLDLTADIVLTSATSGRARNSNTFKIVVAAAAANPTNTILASFTGTSTEIVCTVTPNDGSNNGSTAVNMTTSDLVEMINNGSITGKTVTITDTDSLRTLQTATGGGAQNLANSGEGDNVTAAFSGGDGQWASAGGDYYTDTSSSFTQHFSTGLENLDIDVTTLVEQWVNSAGNVLGHKPNYGFGIRLGDSEEAATKSYYTKKFFSRETEFWFKRPVLEAQFEDGKRDDRGNFYISSSLLDESLVINNLYFYNNYRGKLRDILDDSTKVPTLKLYYSSGSVPEGDARGFLNTSATAVSSLSATRISKGIYKARVAVTGGIITDTYPYLIDVWSFGDQEVLTGSAISPITHSPKTHEESERFVLSMTNLKPEYGSRDIPKLRLYVREKNWSPNIYTVAKNKPENYTIFSGSYRVIRLADELTVVEYGTGSVKYSELSYDQNGNYFEFNMNMLEPGYQYGFKFAIYDDYTKSYLEQPYLFKFRVNK